MDDLITFLRACLDDDERMARAADSGRWVPEDKGITFEYRADDFHDGEAQARLVADTRANQWHIANWDPSRVMAEVEAKRHILAAYAEADHLQSRPPGRPRPVPADLTPPLNHPRNKSFTKKGRNSKVNDVDMGQVRDLVGRSIRAATPPDQMVEHRTRPESEYSWQKPAPLAGLHAALAVAEIAQRQAYEYVRLLRGEGTSWRQAADLLHIPWSDEYSRIERAYELVLGPAPEHASAFHQRNLYWHCGGTGGCGQYITDHGPYDGHPGDVEDGHADDCARHAAEIAAWRAEREEQEHRDHIADTAMESVTDRFGQETVRRARWTLAHGGQYGPWSHSETLAVALVLHDDDGLGGYTRADAVDRVLSGMDRHPADSELWLACLRAAATGRIDRDDLREKLGLNR